MAGFSRVNVPVATRASVSSVHSSSEPVHQWMRSGLGQRGDLVDEVEDALVGRGVGAGACVSAVMRWCSLSRIRGFRLAVRRWTSRPSSVSTVCRGVVVVRTASLSATDLFPGASACVLAPRDGARVTPRLGGTYWIDQGVVASHPNARQQSRIHGPGASALRPEPRDNRPTGRRSSDAGHAPPTADSLISGTPRGSAILVQSFARVGGHGRP